jgi:hypothetical protein
MGFSFFKRSKSAPQMQDVFFDEKKEVVSLREKTITIELSKKALRDFYFTHHTFILSILFGVTLITIGLFFSQSKADTALLYAGQCLGGWENPENAQGAPDLKEDEEGTQYTLKNSAVLKNTQGDLYCGGFTGEIPKDAAPKKFVIKLRWTIDDGSISHTTEQPVEVLDVSPSDTTSTTNTTESSTNVSPVENQVVPTEVLPVETLPTEIPTTEPAPQSLMRFFGAPVYAEESTQTLETIIATSTEVKSDIKEPTDPATDTAPLLIEEQKDETTQEQSLPETKIDEPTDPATDTTPLLIEEQKDETTQEQSLPETKIDEPFLLLEYSIDGQDWKELKKITHTNWTENEIELPIDLATWDDAKKIQIRLSPIVTIDTAPVIYLDALWIEAEYSPFVVEEVKDITNSDPIKLHVTSLMAANTLFTGYVVRDPDQGEILHLSAPEGSQFRFYNTNDPNFMVLISRETGETLVPTYTLTEGDLVVVATKDSMGCQSISITECEETEGFLGKISITLVSLLKKNQESIKVVPETTETDENKSVNTVTDTPQAIQEVSVPIPEENSVIQ